MQGTVALRIYLSIHSGPLDSYNYINMLKAKSKTLARWVKGGGYNQRLLKAKIIYLASNKHVNSFIEDFPDAEYKNTCTYFTLVYILNTFLHPRRVPPIFLLLVGCDGFLALPPSTPASTQSVMSSLMDFIHRHKYILILLSA